ELAAALETALTLVPKDAPGRVLVLSDARWTGRDPAAVASWAAAREVALDYRALERTRANDLAVARLDAPATVAPGESFLITAWVQSPVRQGATFELRRGSQVLATGKRQFTSGLNRLTFRDRAAESGAQTYTPTVHGAGADPVPETNTARLLVGVHGPRPLLLVTAAPQTSGFARLLQGGGLKVRAQTPGACAWTLEELSKYSAVVLEN